MNDFSDLLGLHSGQLQRPQGAFPVRPVPEHRADGDLLPVYQDLKATLGVPWVGVITQAVAHYRPFFIASWRQFSANAATPEFEQACNAIRLLATKQARAQLAVQAQYQRLQALGYSDRELAQIQAMLDVFDLGNPKYLVLATAIKESLCFGRSLGGASSSKPMPPATTGPTGAIPVMVEEHHAIGGVREVYQDIKATLNLPFVNSDYKAMARWPSYLQMAWLDLRPLVGSAAYNGIRQQIHDAALAAAKHLPHRYCMRHSEALAAGLSDAEAKELMRVISLFQWLLSGLVLNVTHFRLSLQPTRQAGPSGPVTS